MSVNKKLSSFDVSISPRNIVNDNGTKYSDFKSSLRIRKSTLLFNLLMPVLMILISIYFFFLLSQNLLISCILFLPFTIWIAFWKLAYKMHFHEAAHYNLHHNKKINDFIANLFFSPFVGMWIKDYRKSHWKHHQHLGTLKDTETSYSQSLTLPTIFQKLTGIYLVKVLMRYFKNYNGEKNGGSNFINFFTSLLYLLSVQLTISFFILIHVSYFAAFAWILSLFIFEPFLSGIRQTLEHRSLEASKRVDYTKTDHGPTNRLFGSDFFSKYFGGAGFNKHLLHHYDPTVSYTRFDELEMFLEKSNVRDYIKSNQTSYYNAFKSLYER